MEKKKDWKFIIGTVVLVAALAVITAFFWRTVAQQAVLVKEEEAKEKENAIEAIYIYQGDVLKTGVFVNMKTDQIFKADIPSEGIYNRNGRLIAGDIPEEGDEFRIYGKHEFSQEDPPVLSGITKMERTGRATLEEAVVYRDLVNKSGDGSEEMKISGETEENGETEKSGEAGESDETENSGKTAKSDEAEKTGRNAGYDKVGKSVKVKESDKAENAVNTAEDGEAMESQDSE